MIKITVPIFFKLRRKVLSILRLLANAVTVDLHNSLAKDRGGKLLDRVPLTESEMAEVEAWVRANTAGLTSHLRKPSAAKFRNLEPGAKYR